MRALLVVALVFPWSALTAQLSPFSITPEIGWVWPTSIFEHNPTYPPAFAGNLPESRTQRLWVHPARLLGGTVEFSAGRGWIVYASGSGSRETVMEYNDSTFGEHLSARSQATIKLWELGAGRSLRLGERLPQLRATLGGGSYRFALNAYNPCNAVYCLLPPAPYRSHYNIPTLVGGLLLRQPVTSHFALEVGGKGSVGRANTENFFVALLPPYDKFEAPKHQIVRTTQLSLRISIF